MQTDKAAEAAKPARARKAAPAATQPKVPGETAGEAAVAKKPTVKKATPAKTATTKKAPAKTATIKKATTRKAAGKAALPAPALLDVIVATLDDAKAEAVEVIDLAGKSSIADHMIVATGRADRHVAAIADRIVQALKDKGFGTPRVEGTEANEWVLIDAGDVIAHIFKPDARSFYNIERLWSADRPRDDVAIAAR